MKRKVGPNWNKFHQWERQYEIPRLRKLTPIERIKVYEELYQTAMRIRQQKGVPTRKREKKI
jgi:hypothetical protein